MPDTPDTKSRILAAAYPLLYREGFARVSVDMIAAAAGVTKKTLYYHFESKDALVGAVLDFQHDHAVKLVAGWADVASDDPLVVVETIFERFADWAMRPDWHGSGFTRITMELADMPGHPARVAARNHKAVVESRLADRLASLGVGNPLSVARQLVVLIEGANALILVHRSRDYAEAAARTAVAVVERALAEQERRR